MEKLDLASCKTNKEVCELVSARVRSIPFDTFISDVQANFVYQKESAKALYTGLANNMNVMLSGSGGYGKSSLIRYVLEYFGLPYTIVGGYKDMPVDALLGLPDMKKLMEDSSYQIKFEESAFYKPGILVGEEFTDIMPATAAALKEILTSKGFHTKNGKIESLISNLIIIGNKTADEIADDDSKKAFYKERFPLQAHVGWESHTKEDYMKFLKLKFPSIENKILTFLSHLFESNHLDSNNTISPRIAEEVAKVYVKDGIDFISNFSIDLANITKIREQAKEDIILSSTDEVFSSLRSLLEDPTLASDTALKSLYIMHKMTGVSITNSNSEKVLRFSLDIVQKLDSVKSSIPSLVDIDDMFKTLMSDDTSS